MTKPLLNRDGQVSRQALAENDRDLARQGRQAGNGGLLVNSKGAGVSVTDPRPRDFWAKILWGGALPGSVVVGPSGDDGWGNRYAWQEMYLTESGTLALHAEGRRGTTTEAVAYEVAGLSNVPDGSIVKMTADPSGDRFTFRYAGGDCFEQERLVKVCPVISAGRVVALVSEYETTDSCTGQVVSTRCEQNSSDCCDDGIGSVSGSGGSVISGEVPVGCCPGVSIPDELCLTVNAALDYLGNPSSDCTCAVGALVPLVYYAPWNAWRGQATLCGKVIYFVASCQSGPVWGVNAWCGTSDSPPAGNAVYTNVFSCDPLSYTVRVTPVSNAPVANWNDRESCCTDTAPALGYIDVTVSAGGDCGAVAGSFGGSVSSSGISLPPPPPACSACPDTPDEWECAMGTGWSACPEGVQATLEGGTFTATSDGACQWIYFASPLLIQVVTVGAGSSVIIDCYVYALAGSYIPVAQYRKLVNPADCCSAVVLDLLSTNCVGAPATVTLTPSGGECP